MTKKMKDSYSFGVFGQELIHHDIFNSIPYNTGLAFWTRGNSVPRVDGKTVRGSPGFEIDLKQQKSGVRNMHRLSLTMVCSLIVNHSQTLNVWYIYLHLVNSYGACIGKYTIHWIFGIVFFLCFSVKKKGQTWKMENEISDMLLVEVDDLNHIARFFEYPRSVRYVQGGPWKTSSQ